MSDRRPRSRSRSRERRESRVGRNTTRGTRNTRGRSGTRRRRNVSPAPSRYPPAGPYNFQYDHIFLLAGHGEETSVAAEHRYRLKPDEFYLTSVTCGHISYIYDTFWYDFLHCYPQIKIPTPYSHTYASMNNLTASTLRTSTSLSKHTLPSNSTKFKVYVPFSEKPYTHSIPATRVYLCSYWTIKESVIPLEFVFNGHSYSTTSDAFRVFKIGISGILTPGHATIKLRSSMRDLRNKSDAVAETFKIPAHHNSPYTLYACLPKSSLELPLSAVPPDPLTAHFKAVIEAMYADSVIKPSDMHPEITYKMLLDYNKTFEEIYAFIKSKLTTRGPILLINNLCRYYKGPAENLTGYNSNTAASPRSHRPKAPSAAAGTPSDV
jgi:hypothetical protein